MDLRVMATGCLLAACLTGSQAVAQKNAGLDPRPTGRSLGDSPDAIQPLREKSFAVDLTRTSAKEKARAQIAAFSMGSEYEDAAKKGETWAQARLGIMYSRESKDPKRWAEAVDLLQAAAQKNDPEALMELSDMAKRGRGLPVSDTVSYAYMRQAAETGAAEAQYQIAMKLLKGEGMAQNPASALEWARKSAAQGNAGAHYAVAQLLIGSAESEKHGEGLAELQRAVEAGHVPAIIALAAAYSRGELGLSKDEARAEALVKPAAERGDIDCQFFLASLYLSGETFPDRRELAEEWLRTAAEGGHPKAQEILRERAKKPSP
ncbi:MAG: tetratricopeptide repeat protein [Chthoniobacterales bacterium]